MGLLDLPLEVLTNILCCLDDPKELQCAYGRSPALCAVSLTSRELHHIAQYVVVRDLKFEVPYGPDVAQTRIRLFNRSCFENPDVAKHIRTADIRWYLMLGFQETPLETYNELLSNLTQVTTLSVELNANRCPWSLPALFDSDPNSFHNLKSLVLRFHNSSMMLVEQFIRLCSFPKLEELTIREQIGCESPHVALKTLDPGDSQAKRLKPRFLKLSHVHQDAVRFALQSAPNLEVLDMMIPGHGIRVERKMSQNTSRGGFDLLYPLSPAGVGELLSPVAMTLKSLELTADEVRFLSHDGSKLDLSQFDVLEVLTISSYLLSGAADTPVASQTGVWRLLPKRLRHFGVEFDGDKKTFHSMDRTRKMADEGRFEELWPREGSDQTLAPLDWIIEIFRRKPEAFPHLKTVALRENDVVDFWWDWGVVQ